MIDTKQERLFFDGYLNGERATRMHRLCDEIDRLRVERAACATEMDRQWAQARKAEAQLAVIGQTITHAEARAVEAEAKLRKAEAQTAALRAQRLAVTHALFFSTSQSTQTEDTRAIVERVQVLRGYGPFVVDAALKVEAEALADTDAMAARYFSEDEVRAEMERAASRRPFIEGGDAIRVAADEVFAVLKAKRAAR